MRGKEDAHDYRYFPDPDLLPLVVDDAWVARIKQDLPELPEPRKARFIKDYELSAYDADVLTASRELADYFEACVKLIQKPKLVCNWVTGPLLGLLNAQSESIEDSPVSDEHLAALLQLVADSTISPTVARAWPPRFLIAALSPCQQTHVATPKP